MQLQALLYQNHSKACRPAARQQHGAVLAADAVFRLPSRLLKLHGGLQHRTERPCHAAPVRPCPGSRARGPDRLRGVRKMHYLGQGIAAAGAALQRALSPGESAPSLPTACKRLTAARIRFLPVDPEP